MYFFFFKFWNLQNSSVAIQKSNEYLLNIRILRFLKLGKHREIEEQGEKYMEPEKLMEERAHVVVKNCNIIIE